MTNKPEQEQESNPHKESNDDKGNRASYKHVKPEKTQCRTRKSIERAKIAFSHGRSPNLV